MGILPNLVGTVEAVCVGAVGEIDSGRRKIVSALIKTPVQGRIAVGPLGLPGDEHVYEDHGGPDLALLAYPREHYDHWRDIGLELPVAGAMGENLTTTGLVETEVHIGDMFEVDPQRRPQGSCRRAAPLRRASPWILGPPEARDSPRKRRVRPGWGDARITNP